MTNDALNDSLLRAIPAVIAETRNRGKERRAFVRWPVALAARCYGTWGSSTCLITQISEAGLTLDWKDHPQTRDEVTVAWKLDDAEPLKITCHLCWSSAEAAGLEFLDASLSDRLRIVAFLSLRSTKL